MGDQEVEVPHPPTDGISSINFSHMNNCFVATSWDKSIRCWEIQGSGVVPRLQLAQQAPILSSAWMGDGAHVAFGSCDNTVKLWNLAQNKEMTIGSHSAPVNCMKFLPNFGILVTGSWDKTIKYWDVRSSTNPVGTVQLNSTVYAMDALNQLIVVGTADKKNHVFEASKPNAATQVVETSLKLQTRTIGIFSDCSGFAVGSIEGRVAIQYIYPKDKDKSFAFKCHREGNDIYAVNSIRFHHQYPDTFVTAGSDGYFHFWDKKSKSRLKQFPKKQNSISCSSFNRDTSFYAYAVSYDWHKGYEGSLASNTRHNIHVMAVKDVDIRPKQSGGK